MLELGSRILFEPELHLAADVLVPDLAGWRRERMAVIPDTAAMTVAPDWVCEVISPATEAIDRGRKLAIYAREGVGHAWLLNPTSRTLEIYVLENRRWTLAATHVGSEVVRAEPFAAFGQRGFDDPSRGPEQRRPARCPVVHGGHRPPPAPGQRSPVPTARLLTARMDLAPRGNDRPGRCVVPSRLDDQREPAGGRTGRASGRLSADQRASGSAGSADVRTCV